MENKQVLVENLSNGRVGINIPDLRLKRIWERKGVKKPIDFETLQQAIYDPGVEFMFKEGILYIDDMDVKIALGLEPEDAKEPENIIILSDQQKRRLLTVAPIQELKDMMNKISNEQKQSLVDFAIENELTNMDRCEILKQFTQVNVIRAVELNRKNKEG